MRSSSDRPPHVPCWRGCASPCRTACRRGPAATARPATLLPQVAQKAGVTKNYITMLERGERKNPSLNIVKKLAKALGVPVPKLLA